MAGNGLLVAAVLTIGLLIPVQALLNAKLGSFIGGPLAAALINFVVGATVLASAMLVTRTAWPQLSAMGETKWWVLLGGCIGACFVFTAAFGIPRLGAALLLALIIAGQMIGALIYDHYGILAHRQIPIDVWRVAGVVLIIGGVLLIQYSGTISAWLAKS